MKEDSSNTHSGTFRIRYIKNAGPEKDSYSKAVPPNFAEIKKDSIRIVIGLVIIVLILTAPVIFDYATMSPEQKAAWEAHRAETREAREAERAEKKAAWDAEQAKMKAEREVDEQKKKAKKEIVELYEKRQKKIKRAFSSKDGSHKKIVDDLKSISDDPDSFRHYETKYQDRGKGVVYVAMEYGDKNKFGAMIRYSIEIIWYVDSDTFVLQALYEGKIRERRW